MADATKVKLGVCNVVAGGVDLGHTMGGVEVIYKPEYHDSSVDAYGKSLIEKYLIGESLSAKVPLAEFTLANLKKAMPQAVLSSATKLTIGAKAGKRSTEDAIQVVLHPIANADADRSEDVVIYKAICASEITLNMKNDQEKVIECEFVGLIDETKSDGNLLGLIGDSTT